MHLMRLRTHSIYLASFMALCSTSTHAQIYQLSAVESNLLVSPLTVGLLKMSNMQISGVDIQGSSSDDTHLTVMSEFQTLSMQGDMITGWQIEGGFQISKMPSLTGSLGLSNFHVNLQAGLINADVYTPTSGNILNQSIWQFDSNQIQTQSSETPWDGDAVNVMLTISLPHLTLTTDGAQWFKDGLNLEKSWEINALNAAAADFGSMTSTQVFMVKNGTVITAVPEASTWAMMGLGLVGLAGLSRARSRQSSAKSA